MSLPSETSVNKFIVISVENANVQIQLYYCNNRSNLLIMSNVVINYDIIMGEKGDDLCRAVLFSGDFSPPKGRGGGNRGQAK